MGHATGFVSFSVLDPVTETDPVMGLPPTASSIGAGEDSLGILVDPVVDVG